jgi:hypothetical protein
VDNVLGLDVSSAQLLVMDAQTRPYAAFSVTEAGSRLVFDNERETLYVVEQVAQRLARYRYAEGAWTALTPVSASLIKDAALSVDGKKLYVLKERQIYQLDLEAADPTLTLVHETDTPAPVYQRFAIANDGMALISPSGSCCLYMWMSGSPTVASYSPGGYYTNALVNASVDGTWVYFIENTRVRYQPGPNATWAYTNAPAVTALNFDGSLMLQNHALAYTDEYAQDAVLVEGIHRGVFGRRADRAYAIRGTDADTYSLGDNIWIVDPTGTKTMSDIGIPKYEVVGSVAVPAADFPQTETINFYYTPATVSADDHTYFFQGQDKLIIVPVGVD